MRAPRPCTQSPSFAAWPEPPLLRGRVVMAAPVSMVTGRGKEGGAASVSSADSTSGRRRATSELGAPAALRCPPLTVFRSLSEPQQALFSVHAAQDDGLLS